MKPTLILTFGSDIPLIYRLNKKSSTAMTFQ